MATACWAFIVVKRPAVETASWLGFRDVARPQHENPSTSYTQACAEPLQTSGQHVEDAWKSAPTQRFRSGLYRFGLPGRGQPAWSASAGAGGARSLRWHRLFAFRTNLLSGEKTRQPTRLSGHCAPRAADDRPRAAVTIAPAAPLPVAQRIVHPPPKRAIQVRVLTGGPSFADPPRNALFPGGFRRPRGLTDAYTVRK